MEKFRLDGKTALITGAAGLLGGEHASALVAAGAAVIITDIDAEKLEQCREKLVDKYPSSKVKAFEMDVTDELSVSRVCDSISLQWPVDILLNNAAIDPKLGMAASNVHASRVENFSRESWDREIAVGLTGAFICSKIFGRAMAARRSGGVILNVASDLSVISPDQRLYASKDQPLQSRAVKPITYSVIKTGLIGLTRYLSTYWADEGIRCNALSPGGVDNNHSDDFKRLIADRVPLGRMAYRDEYQSAIQFLCSDASSYMTGQNIVIDGGRSVW